MSDSVIITALIIICLLFSKGCEIEREKQQKTHEYRLEELRLKYEHQKN